jgi:photosystem II stability/assembly factor-like uncharacterized protein
LRSTFFINNTTGWVCGNHPENNYKSYLYKTTDGGNTWNLLYSAYDDHPFEDIYFVDANLGYSSGGGGMAKTTDGGLSWSPIGTPGEYNDIHFTNASTGYVVSGWLGNNGGILKTTDGGSNWIIVHQGVLEIKAIDFVDENIGIAVGSDGIILKTTDEGNSWNTVTGPPDVEVLEDVQFVNSNVIFAVGYSFDIIPVSRIIASVDGGSSWTTTYTETTFTALLSFSYSIDFPSLNVGYAGGENSNYVKTTNGGGVTGIENNGTLAYETHIYPNPTTGQVLINLPGNLHEEVTVQLFNTLGQTVFVDRIEESRMSSVALDLSHLPKGFYKLHLSTSYSMGAKGLVIK